ncbi:MAG: putative metalloprotease with PDZ domain, partial [Polaromonas sp.]
MTEASTPIHYRVEIADLQAHLFKVTLTVAAPAALQKVALPVWIPGSYLVREFAGHLQGLGAKQGSRALVADQIEQLDKCSWLIHCAPNRPLVLVYEVYANDHSVRTATLGDARGFFNGTSLCLRVEGQEHGRHELD